MHFFHFIINSGAIAGSSCSTGGVRGCTRLLPGAFVLLSGAPGECGRTTLLGDVKRSCVEETGCGIGATALDATFLSGVGAAPANTTGSALVDLA
jgi:hypothetical protein